MVADSVVWFHTVEQGVQEGVRTARSYSTVQTTNHLNIACLPMLLHQFDYLHTKAAEGMRMELLEVEVHNCMDHRSSEEVVGLLVVDKYPTPLEVVAAVVAVHNLCIAGTAGGAA
jgi:hypothetical protein